MGFWYFSYGVDFGWGKDWDDTVHCLNKKRLKFILEEHKKEEFVFSLGEPNIRRGKPFLKKILVTLRPRAKRNKQNMDTILK